MVACTKLLALIHLFNLALQLINPILQVRVEGLSLRNAVLAVPLPLWEGLQWRRTLSCCISQPLIVFAEVVIEVFKIVELHKFTDFEMSQMSAVLQARYWL